VAAACCSRASRIPWSDPEPMRGDYARATPISGFGKRFAKGGGALSVFGFYALFAARGNPFCAWFAGHRFASVYWLECRQPRELGRASGRERENCCLCTSMWLDKRVIV